VQTAGPDRAQIVLANATLCARLIAAAALLRTESRGAHTRADYPASDPAWQRRTVFARDTEIVFSATV
jgi:L-aspartate oxidase